MKFETETRMQKNILETLKSTLIKKEDEISKLNKILSEQELIVTN